jgi:hypothetical protein
LTLGARRRAGRRRPGLAWLLALGGAAVVFAIGVALGQAIEENRGDGDTQTSIRTLAPETLPAETVTVTVTTP